MKTVIAHICLILIIPLSACSTDRSSDDLHELYKSLPLPHASMPQRYAYLYRGALLPESVEESRQGLPYDKISLERTGCLGACPVYTVTLGRNGQAQYFGEQHTSMEGDYRGRVDLQTYGRLCYLIERLQITELKEEYRAPWTCSYTTILRVHPSDSDNVTEIVDYGPYGPIDLWAVQMLIDTLADSITWEPAGP